MKLETSILGWFAWFVRAGDVIDGVTVGREAFPDVDPIENWRNFGCVIEGTHEVTTQENNVTCPAPTGGYVEKTDIDVLRDRYLLNCEQTSELAWELDLGFASPITDGTAQSPLIKKDRHIYGWLKLQQRARDGVDRIVMNVWGKLRLSEPLKGMKDPTRPVFSFDVEFSPIATAEPQNITA